MKKIGILLVYLFVYGLCVLLIVLEDFKVFEIICIVIFFNCDGGIGVFFGKIK